MKGRVRYLSTANVLKFGEVLENAERAFSNGLPITPYLLASVTQASLSKVSTWRQGYSFPPK